MFYRSMFPRNLYSELSQLQRAAQQAFDLGPNSRGAWSGYPAINVGQTPHSVEVYVYAPGMDPKGLDVQFEGGTLSVAGERQLPKLPEQATLQTDQRFAGRFRRAIALPDDVDASKIAATYTHGVLHISIPKAPSAQARRITIA